MRWVAAYDTLSMVNDIAVAGDRAFLALGFPRGQVSGLAMIDISNPADPRTAGSAATTSRAYHVAVDGNIACLAATSLIVIDVSPAPHVIAYFELPYPAFNVSLAGGIAYVTCGEWGLFVVDMSNPAAPLLLGAVDTPGAAHDVAVAGSYAYLADGASGLQVIDVSKPSLPRLRGKVDTEGRAYDVALAGSWVYVAGDRDLAAIDVTDPDAPVLTGTAPTPDYARSVSVADGRAIVAINSGILTFDLSSPGEPIQTGWFGVPQTVAAAAAGSLIYVANNSIWGGINVIDMTHPTSPPEIGLAEAYGAMTVGLEGTHAVLGAGYLPLGDLVLFDVADPGAPTVLGSTRTGYPPRDVVIRGSYAYIAEWANVVPEDPPASQFEIIDISQPSHLRSVASMPTAVAARGVALSGAFAYVVDGSSGLLVIDVTNPASPVLSAILATLGYAMDISVDGHFAYVANTSGLAVVDISVAEDPRLRGVAEVGAYAVAVTGNLACVIGYRSLCTVDVQDPDHPRVLGSVALPDAGSEQSRVRIAGRIAYITGGSYGIQVVDLAEASHPRLVGSASTHGFVCGVGLSDQLVYLATSYGLEIVPAQCESPDPVLLSGPSAVSSANGIWIRWDVHEDVFTSFSIWRAIGLDPPPEAYMALNADRPIPAQGPWEYLDSDVVRGLTYSYLVRALRGDGGTETIGPVSASWAPRRKDSLIAIPNPARGQVTLDWDVAPVRATSLRIYDSMGHLVCTLLGDWAGGQRSAIWDGRNDRGQRVSGGRYFARLTWPGGAATTRLTYLGPK